MSPRARLCYNRRSHEDAKGLPDGHLLGNYQPKSSGANSPKGQYIALSADEKKAIMAGDHAPPVGKHGTEDVLREQRDQGLREIGRLRTENTSLKSQVENYKQKLKTMTFRKLLLIRLVQWPARPDSGQQK